MNDVKTVLLVDDDLAAIAANSERLQREGFRVETAEDGHEALHQLSACEIDLVVLNPVLPTFSGWEVFKRIRADERLRLMPLVVLSELPAQKLPKELNDNQTRVLTKSGTDYPALIKTIKQLLAASTFRPSIRSGESDTGVKSSPLAANNLGQNPVEANEASDSNRSSGFLKKVAKSLPKVREDCFGYIKSPATPVGQQHFAALRKNLNSLATSSQNAGCVRIDLLVQPFEALLSNLAEKPAAVTPSILQTIAQAVDCLILVANHPEDAVFGSMLMPHALVVDDDPVSNEVNVTALQQAGFDTTCLEDPLTALAILSSTEFDLIVLDVNMPALTGFEVCEKLRELPQGKTTPVIFLTAFNNFENRKQSVLSGGGDFITKPVSTRELALKATIHLLKSQMRVSDGKTTAEKPPPPAQIASRDKLSADSRSAGAELPQPAGSENPAPVSSPSAEPKKDADMFTNDQNGIIPLNAQVFARGSTGRDGVNATHPSDMLHEELFARCKNLEQETAELRQSRDELQDQLKLHEAIKSSSDQKIRQLEDQLQEKVAQLAGADAEATASPSIRTSPGKENEKLKAAELAASRMETVLKEKDDSYRMLEEELIPLRKIRDQLQQKQQQGAAELDRLKTKLAQETAERARTETDLRSQLEAVKLALETAESALKEKEDSYRLLEEELAPLRKAREQFQQKLQHHAAELGKVRSDFEQQSAVHAQSEADLQHQLEAAKQRAAQAESALRQKETQCEELEQTLPPLREQCQKLENSNHEVEAELVRVKAELTQKSTAYARSEFELRDQLSAAEQAQAQTQTALSEAQTRLSELEQELSRTRGEYQRLEEQQQQSLTEVKNVKADLDRESAMRARLESEAETLVKAKEQLEASLAQWHESLAASNAHTLDVERQLSESTTAMARVSEELKKERADRQRLEQRASSLGNRLRGLHEELGKHLAD